MHISGPPFSSQNTMIWCPGWCCGSAIGWGRIGGAIALGAKFLGACRLPHPADSHRYSLCSPAVWAELPKGAGPGTTAASADLKRFCICFMAPGQGLFLPCPHVAPQSWHVTCALQYLPCPRCWEHPCTRVAINKAPSHATSYIPVWPHLHKMSRPANSIEEPTPDAQCLPLGSSCTTWKQPK